jgi:hypothetical protein
MPRWLTLLLLAVGLVIAAAFLTEPVLAAHRRHRQPPAPAPAPDVQAGQGGRPGVGGQPPGPGQACIVLADHDRLVVTRSTPDDTIYVLRPPGQDPHAILQVARLVLPEGPYGELARHLGVPAIETVD